MNKDLQEKINQLSMLDQSIQQYAMQKQQFAAQLNEVESAEKELDIAKSHFKIVGNIMVSADKEKLKKDLAEKKEILSLRVESFEKQEEKLREKAQSLQNEVLAAMKEQNKE
jgi:prefoldin beta subunit